MLRVVEYATVFYICIVLMTGPHSSVGQSNALVMRGSLVRIRLGAQKGNQKWFPFFVPKSFLSSAILLTEKMMRKTTTYVIIGLLLSVALFACK